MRFANLHVRTGVLASLLLAACSCQTAQKPVAMLPPATAPSLQATASAPSPKPAAAPKSTPQSQPATSAAAPPQTAPKAPSESAAPAAPSDPVADLVVRVETEYQEGLLNYQAGKTDAAKQNSDNAINDLLTSHLHIRSHERNQTGYDSIVK